MPIRRPDTTYTSSVDSSPDILRGVAEYILGHPKHVLKELMKTYQVLEGRKISPSDVSLIYRREVGNRKSKHFDLDLMAIPWLVIKYKGSIQTVTELITTIEQLSGLKASDLEPEKEEEDEVVTQQNESTLAQVQGQLPKPATDDTDASDLIAEQADYSK